MMKYSIYTILVLALTLASCNKLTDDVDFPPQPLSLVIHSFIYSGMDTIEVRVEKTHQVFEQDVSQEKLIITDARVFLSTDNEVEHQLAYNETKGNYFIKSHSLPILEGKQYHLRVEHDSFPTARSQVTIPVKNTSFQLLGFDSLDLSYEKHYTIRTGFNDMAGVENYYFLYGYLNYSYIRNSHSENPEIVSYNDGIYQYHLWFSDENADGREFLRGGQVICTDTSWPESLSFTLWTVDRNLYKYQELVHALDNLQDDPFATPINMYTNIDNALGVFAAYAIYQIEIDAEEIPEIVNFRNAP